MNAVVLGVSIVSLWFVLFGLIFGFARGNGRSITRFVVIVLCIVGAFLLREPIANGLMNIKIGGTSLQESLMQSIQQDSQQIAEVLVRLVKVCFAAVSFVLAFLLLKWLTALIVDPILFAFFPKTGKEDKKTGKVRKTKRLLGGVFGLLQGVLIALVVCIPLNGVVTNYYEVLAVTSKTTETTYVRPVDGVYADATDNGDGSGVSDGESGDGQTNGGSDSSDQSTADMLAVLEEYVNSPVGKIYNAIGSVPFDWVGSMEIDGKTYTVSGQMGAFKGLMELANAMGEISDGGNADMLDPSNTENITKVFDDLDKMWSGLSEESKETVAEVAKAASDMTDGEIDLSGVDFVNIDFKKEGEVFANISEIYNDVQGKDQASVDDCKRLIDAIAKSDLILPLVASGDAMDIADADVRAEITDYVNNMDTTETKRDMLLKFLGLSGSTDNGGESGNETPSDVQQAA